MSVVFTFFGKYTDKMTVLECLLVLIDIQIVAKNCEAIHEWIILLFH